MNANVLISNPSPLQNSPTPLENLKLSNLKLYTLLNPKGDNTMNNGHQFKWVIADHFCPKATAYLRYTTILNARGEKFFTYCIDVLKGGGFYLHTIEYGAHERLPKLAQNCTTLDEAEKVVNEHYAYFLTRIKPLLPEENLI